MILGFHYHVPAVRIENIIYTQGMIGLFIDELALYVEEIVWFAHEPLNKEISKMDYPLKAGNVRLVSLGKHFFFIRRHLHSCSIKKAIKSNLTDYDLMLIRGPSPFLPLVSEIVLKSRKPNAMLLIGDYEKGLEVVNISAWKKVFLRFYYRKIQAKQRKYAVDSMVLVNSKVLYEEYKGISRNCYEVSTTTIRSDDISGTISRELHQPIRLLFTGRIEPAKSLDIIIESMRILDINGTKSELHLVGWEESSGYLVYLNRLAGKYNLDDQVIFHGAKTIGPELFREYQNSDFFILPTTSNEGFPRTIWEAMANSVPVISSAVGSIPSILTDNENALLFSPGDYRMLATRLMELIKNEKLRKRLVAKGNELVRSKTLETQGELLASLLIDYNQRYASEA